MFGLHVCRQRRRCTELGVPLEDTVMSLDFVRIKANDLQLI